MIAWIQQHAAELLFGYFLLSSLVGAMEKPTEKNGMGYRYIYRLGHLLAFNIGHALRVKFPDYAPDKAQADAEEEKLR